MKQIIEQITTQHLSEHDAGFSDRDKVLRSLVVELEMSRVKDIVNVELERLSRRLEDLKMFIINPSGDERDKVLSDGERDVLNFNTDQAILERRAKLMEMAVFAKIAVSYYENKEINNSDKQASLNYLTLALAEGIITFQEVEEKAIKILLGEESFSVDNGVNSSETSSTRKALINELVSKVSPDTIEFFTNFLQTSINNVTAIERELNDTLLEELKNGSLEGGFYEVFDVLLRSKKNLLLEAATFAEIISIYHTGKGQKVGTEEELLTYQMFLKNSVIQGLFTYREIEEEVLNLLRIKKEIEVSNEEGRKADKAIKTELVKKAAQDFYILLETNTQGSRTIMGKELPNDSSELMDEIKYHIIKFYISKKDIRVEGEPLFEIMLEATKDSIKKAIDFFIRKITDGNEVISRTDLVVTWIAFEISKIMLEEIYKYKLDDEDLLAECKKTIALDEEVLDLQDPGDFKALLEFLGDAHKY